MNPKTRDKVEESLATLLSYEDRKNTISAAEFANRFEVIPNAPDGNCLFNAVSQLLNGTDIQYEATRLRSLVCNYHKQLLQMAQYNVHQFERKINGVDPIEKYILGVMGLLGNDFVPEF